MTDAELDAAWAARFGGTGPWANDDKRLNLTSLTIEERRSVGELVAYYHKPTESVFEFYAGVLTVPNRAIMEHILNLEIRNE